MALENRISQSRNHTTKRNNKDQGKKYEMVTKRIYQTRQLFYRKRKRKNLQAPSNINKIKGIN